LAAWIAFAPAPADSAVSWQQERNRLRRVLEHERELTQAATSVHRGLAVLERERTSLAYTTEILEHSSREAMRRLSAYRGQRSDREGRTRKRARALYKLVRGGVARLVFEDLDGRDREGAQARIARGNALRFLVRNDLGELQIYQQAEVRASAELAASTRERQALQAMGTIHAMQEHALQRSEASLDPELHRASIRRRRMTERLVNEDQDEALRANRALLALLRRDRLELRASRGLAASSRLVAPVPGPVVGRFGDDRDRLLRLPIVRNGVELRARTNELVRALGDGRVALVAELPSYETVVVLDHGGGQYSMTARLWRVAVAEGDEVEAGDPLGRVAPKRVSDGLGTTVYFELRHGEKPIDPIPVMRRAIASR